MNRHRELAQMMRAAAGPPPSDLPWVHKWDFTAVVGATVPDLVNGVDLTMSGSYTSDSSGTRPTSATAACPIVKGDLLIDVGKNRDPFTLLVAVANMYSAGVGSIYGRYIDGYDFSYTGLTVRLGASVSSIAYRTAIDTIQEMAVNSVIGVASSLSLDSDEQFRMLVGDALTSVGGAMYWTGSADAYIMNRPDLDRAADGLFTGAGIISGVISDTDFRAAVAELLAL